MKIDFKQKIINIMTLVRTNQDVFPSISNLLDEVFNNDFKRSNYSPIKTTLPKVNIREDENGYEVELAAPGFEKKDFNINVEENVLTISSEKKEDQKEEDKNYSRREFSFQSFSRSFTLPDSADAEKIKAKYDNGILAISISKKEEAKPRPPKSISIS